MVGPAGLEPATPGLRVRRSGRLSYGPYELLNKYKNYITPKRKP